MYRRQPFLVKFAIIFLLCALGKAALALNPNWENDNPHLPIMHDDGGDVAVIIEQFLGPNMQVQPHRAPIDFSDEWDPRHPEGYPHYPKEIEPYETLYSKSQQSIKVATHLIFSQAMATIAMIRQRHKFEGYYVTQVLLVRSAFAGGAIASICAIPHALEAANIPALEMMKNSEERSAKKLPKLRRIKVQNQTVDSQGQAAFEMMAFFATANAAAILATGVLILDLPQTTKWNSLMRKELGEVVYRVGKLEVRRVSAYLASAMAATWAAALTSSGLRTNIGKLKNATTLDVESSEGKVLLEAADEALLLERLHWLTGLGAAGSMLIVPVLPEGQLLLLTVALNQLFPVSAYLTTSVTEKMRALGLENNEDQDLKLYSDSAFNAACYTTALNGLAAINVWRLFFKRQKKQEKMFRM